jgi:4-amino-4-deoxy-L-arabinose transferase-like glycosyltransferase
MIWPVSYSWDTHSAASMASAPASAGTLADTSELARRRVGALAKRIPRPELLGVMALAAVLDLWALSRNGWANTYYAAAVKSMSGGWHDFLFASLDKGGVMTVDKPPLALWVQALSVRVFGFHSLSLLVPQALMGVASVALTYDLVRRRFGRVGGFVAALALALTPITVAISRHNNPDALLVLCCVGALWCTVRALERARAGGSARWLVAAGVCVGLGFETKMLVALVVVPGIVAAWLWCAPAARGWLRALRELVWGGVAMLVVGGAWPLLVELTPASQRPWISGTSDNRVLSLIFEYNGLGRLDGQAGGPGGLGAGPGAAGGGANTLFGGANGPLRLLNAALGGQAGWLLGFAVACAVAIFLSGRLRRADERTGWLLAVGGAFATTAVVFSFAGGIFHPYYVSLLAPFAAALVGAGAAQLISGGVNVRIAGPLVVRGDYPGQLPWLPGVLVAVGLLAALALAVFSSRRVRLVACGAALAALLAAPATWAFDTLGHATSSTFPAGGPASIESGAGPGGPGGPGGRRGALFGAPGGSLPGGGGAGGAGVPGAEAGGPSGLPGAGGIPGEGPPSAGGPGGGVPGAGAFAGRSGGAPGSPFGGGVSASVESYVRANGGGTIAVASQSSAAASILAGESNVAGLGGFSGRESDVSAAWLAQEVRSGKIRWVLDDEAGARTDKRVGARKAMAAVARACSAVTLSSSSAASEASPGAFGQTAAATLYDCAGHATALAGAAAQESRA